MRCLKFVLKQNKPMKISYYVILLLDHKLSIMKRYKHLVVEKISLKYLPRKLK